MPTESEALLAPKRNAVAMAWALLVRDPMTRSIHEVVDRSEEICELMGPNYLVHWATNDSKLRSCTSAGRLREGLRREQLRRDGVFGEFARREQLQRDVAVRAVTQQYAEPVHRSEAHPRDFATMVTCPGTERPRVPLPRVPSASPGTSLLQVPLPRVPSIRPGTELPRVPLPRVPSARPGTERPRVPLPRVPSPVTDVPRRTSITIVGTLHPCRKGKWKNPRRLPPHVAAQYRAADMWSTREDKARVTFDEESLAHFLSMNPTFGHPQVSQKVVREANRIRREDAEEHEEDQKWQKHAHLYGGT